MSKKKILVFIDWYLPGYNAGGPIRSLANLISYLSDEFDFFIVTRDTDYMDTIPYDSIKKNSWNKLPDGSQVYYISEDNLNKSVIKRLIKKVNADVIYLNSIYSFYFTILPLLIIKKKKNRLVIAARGMLAPSAIAIKTFRKRLFLSFSKNFGLFNNVIFQATTEDEKNQIKIFFPRSIIKIVSNLPRKIPRQTAKRIVKIEGEVRLLNVARIAPEKNLLFALEILKSVNGRVIFDFFGPIYNSNYWEKCKNVIANFPTNITSTYRGIADGEQIFKLMENYHFLFLPSLGENFGHIILEAMSSGLPVIISDKTPWKNLTKENAGWDIPLAEQKKVVEIIESCVYMKQHEYDLHSSSARKFALSYMNNHEIIKQNKMLFQ